LIVAEITRLYAFDQGDLAGMGRAGEVKALPDGWRDDFRARLERRRVPSAGCVILGVKRKEAWQKER
jgi:3-alpha domain-containing YiiM-like protein